LMAADMLNSEQLGRAAIKAKDTGMQMARVMVLNRDLSSWAMNAAITAQLFVRSKKISKEQAVEALHTVVRRRISVEQALFEKGLYSEKGTQTVRIGELVAMAGFLSDGDMLECLEIELIKEKQFGQILLEQGLVTQDLLEAAIVLQDMVGNNTVKAYQAAEALKQVKARGVSVYQAVAENYTNPLSQTKDLTPANLLIDSGLISEPDLQKVCDINEPSVIKVGKRVLATGALSESMLYTTLRTYSLYNQGFVSADMAIALLKKCMLEAITLDDALAKQGLILPARMQWIWT